jgi:hypothetical protein
VIDRRLAEELDQYRGLFVAIEDGQVVASADSVIEVLARAREQSFPDPFIFRGPGHAEPPALRGEW